MRQFFQRHPLIVLVIPLGMVFYFVYVGLAWNILVSLSGWTGLRVDYSFKGFGNYLRMLDDSVFWLSLKNTLLLFAIIPICVVLGLFLAVILDKGLKGTNFFRNVFLLPFALSFVVTGTLWAWMYNPANGIINSLLRAMGLGFLAGTWHTAQETVMPAIILALVWQFSGYASLIFLAGLKSVPENQVQAAYLDGASSLKVFWRVILPQLKAPLTTAIVVIAMYALRSFDFIWVLTGRTRLFFPHSVCHDVSGDLPVNSLRLWSCHSHSIAGARSPADRTLHL